MCGLSTVFDIVLKLEMTSMIIKDETNCRHRPMTLDVSRALSADVHSRSSVISVADHVEHLTDTVMGQSVSLSFFLC